MDYNYEPRKGEAPIENDRANCCMVCKYFGNCANHMVKTYEPPKNCDRLDLCYEYFVNFIEKNQYDDVMNLEINEIIKKIEESL